MLSRLFARREPQARPLFALGSLRLSGKVHWLASKGLIDPLPYVQRHVRGDWGDVDREDWEANEASLREGLHLFSVYHDRNGVKFWVITEADRSATTVLLPEDY